MSFTTYSAFVSRAWNNGPRYDCASPARCSNASKYAVESLGEGDHPHPERAGGVGEADPGQVVGVVGHDHPADLGEQLVLAARQHQRGVGAADHAAGALDVPRFRHVADRDDDALDVGVVEPVVAQQAQAHPPAVGAHRPEVLCGHRPPSRRPLAHSRRARSTSSGCTSANRLVPISVSAGTPRSASTGPASTSMTPSASATANRSPELSTNASNRLSRVSSSPLSRRSRTRPPTRRRSRSPSRQRRAAAYR